MDSVNETPGLSQCDKMSQNIEFNEQNWNCVTSEAFLKSYIQYLMKIDAKKDTNGVETENKSTQDGKRTLSDPSASSDAKRMKLDCEHPITGDYQLTTITKTNDWHQKLCKCFQCLKMYQDYNIEFLFGIKNIEWLPTEILLTIFTSLLPSDRRIASECCNRFHEIWLCDDFIDDRRLVFNKCVLDPKRAPLSIFFNTQRNYRHLVFGDVIIKGKQKFPAHFSETVRTIELSEEFDHSSVSENFSFLSQFPNLKEINVDNVDQLLANFPELPKTVESLKISYAEWDGYINRNVEAINKLKSNYLDKTSDSVRVELDDLILPQHILTFTDSQRNKIQKVKLWLENQSAFKLPRFNNLKVLKLCFYKATDYDEEIVDDYLQEQCPALQYLYIRVNDKLPHKDWSFLKKLAIFDILKTELPRFRIFGNLQKLYIIAKRRQKCFFMHETVVNKNLKTLEIHYDDDGTTSRCFTCFQTITKSFPELEHLSYDFQVTNNHLKELVKNTPKLQHLELERLHPSSSFVCLPNLTELTLGYRCSPQMIKTWPLMLQMRKFKFQLRCLDFKTMKLFEKMPALEKLKITCDDIDGNQVSLFETLSKSLKRLKTFRLDCPLLKVTQENYLKIIDVMAETCIYLKHIKITCGDLEKAVWEQKLQEHSTLRTINNKWLKY